MASFNIHTTLFILTFIFLSQNLTDGKFSEQFPETKADHHVDKMSHLHFYFHDIVSGRHPTAITVAGQKNKFGGTAIVDDPLTEGVEPGSKVVGRAQGMYAMSSQDGASLLMVLNFVFNEGKYNGSSVSILGRNQFLETVREMPIVGGSGLFRFARGRYLLVGRSKFSDNICFPQLHPIVFSMINFLSLDLLSAAIRCCCVFISFI